MKINRFIAMAAIALMVVAGLGFATVRSFAQTTQPAVVATATQEASNQGNQQGDQTGDQTGGPGATEPAGSATEAPGAVESNGVPGAVEPTDVAGAADAAGAADPAGRQDQQSPSYTGSITLTLPANSTNLSETAEAAALASQAKITADQANTAALAANPGTSVVKTGLGDENGTLIYSVELSNGSDVKVDAGNAAVLATDAAGQN